VPLNPAQLGRHLPTCSHDRSDVDPWPKQTRLRHRGGFVVAPVRETRFVSPTGELLLAPRGRASSIAVNGRRASPRTSECAGRVLSWRGRRNLVRPICERDQQQCTFVDADGNRCPERWGLELHHDEVPFTRGGPHTAANVTLVCRAHNRYLAEQEFGADFVEEKIAGARAFPGECDFSP